MSKGNTGRNLLIAGGAVLGGIVLWRLLGGTEAQAAEGLTGGVLGEVVPSGEAQGVVTETVVGSTEAAGQAGINPIFKEATLEIAKQAGVPPSELPALLGRAQTNWEADIRHIRDLEAQGFDMDVKRIFLAEVYNVDVELINAAAGPSLTSGLAAEVPITPEGHINWGAYYTQETQRIEAAGGHVMSVEERLARQGGYEVQAGYEVRVSDATIPSASPAMLLAAYPPGPGRGYLPGPGRGYLPGPGGG